MRAFLSSLYGKISVVYLFLLLALGAILVGLAERSFTRFMQEADQKLNRTLAQNLAREFSPFLQDSLDVAGVARTMHYLMVMNPRVELYLLDREGQVLAFFGDTEQGRRPRVRLAPIRRFLGGESGAALLGDDPRHAGVTKPFSVAPIRYNGDELGYLYVILGGAQYDSAVDMVGDSAIARVTVLSLAVILAFAALVGLVLFFFLTRRFRSMTDGVRRFKGGDLSRRLPAGPDDEIGRLARAFNQMADTIEANMAELRRTDDLRRELVANVSHDLRSPLAAIQGYVETILMKDATLPPADRTRYLTIILDTTTQLSRLVNELFDLSRLDARQVQPHFEACSLAELAQDVVMKFRPAAERHAVDLQAILPPPLPLVQADIGLMERVLSNLIDNALRFTPANGTVRVGLKADAERVSVFVADSGPGIPPDEIPHLTGRFYRVDKSRTRASGGAGLGLAIAQKILALHGSTLHIDSTLGAGTTVSFDLSTNGRR